MKAVVVALLVLSSQALITADSGMSRVPTPADLIAGGPYDRCIEILEKILIEANDLAAHIMNKEWAKVVPIAVRLGKHIYDDIQCFTHPTISPPRFLELENDPTECIMKHIRAAAEAIQRALDALQNKDPREAIRQALIAIAHIHEAKMCK